MSDFNPGPGWRRFTPNEVAPTDETLLHRPAGGIGLPEQWVREAPVPPLPTAEDTVIDAWWGTENHRPMHLYEGAWHSRLGNAYTDTEMAQVTRFEILAEPRATTAKAVADYLDEDGSPTIAEDVRRKFGVES